MKKDLKVLYKEQVVPSLIKEFGYKNIEQVPKIVKISINRGVGEGGNAHLLDKRNHFHILRMSKVIFTRARARATGSQKTAS